MAELIATAVADMALNAGLKALSGPHVSTRSAGLIQMMDQGQVQFVRGSFTYAADGAMTGGTVRAIEAEPAFTIDGLDIAVADYAAALATGGVFGLRMALFAGDDTLFGSTSDDRLLGFDGDDLVLGGFGSDDLNGNRGADTVDGGYGADTLHGGQGDDRVDGGDGDDLATGSLGRDTVAGGAGHDLVYGGQGEDQLRGGDGNDFLSGDLGTDVLYGDLGADTFFMGHGSGNDAVEDFDPAAGDRIAILAFVNGTAIDSPADLLPRIRLHPDGQYLDLGDGNGVLIRNYPGSDVTAEHFLIV